MRPSRSCCHYWIRVLAQHGWGNEKVQLFWRQLTVSHIWPFDFVFSTAMQDSLRRGEMHTWPTHHEPCQVDRSWTIIKSRSTMALHDAMAQLRFVLHGRTEFPYYGVTRCNGASCMKLMEHYLLDLIRVWYKTRTIEKCKCHTVFNHQSQCQFGLWSMSTSQHYDSQL
jgi:hypothetical protein